MITLNDIDSVTIWICFAHFEVFVFFQIVCRRAGFEGEKYFHDDDDDGDDGGEDDHDGDFEVTYFVFQRKNHNTQTIWVQREFLYKDMVSFCMLMSWLGKTANITRLGILICTNVGY